MDNRLPLLKAAAMKALMAIADKKLEENVRDGTQQGFKENVMWLVDRLEMTGLSVDQRMAEAHDALQETLRLFEELD